MNVYRENTDFNKPYFKIGAGIIILLIILALLFGVSIWWLNQIPYLQGLWNNFSLDKKSVSSICEKSGFNSPVRQPINTFSSIIYFVVAGIVFKSKKIQQENRDIFDSKVIKVHSFYVYIFGIILLYVFTASSFYHASLTDIAHQIDYSAVFAFSLFPVMYFVQRKWLVGNYQFTGLQIRNYSLRLSIVFFIIWLLLSVFTPKEMGSIVTFILILSFYVFALTIIIDKRAKPGTQYLLYSIISIMVALICFEVDRFKIVCNPDSYFQAHALWNIFIGVAGFYFYWYLQSDVNSFMVLINRNVLKVAES